MSKAKNKIFFCLSLLLLTIFCILPAAAFASEKEENTEMEKSISVSIPVSCVGENTEESFTYTLAPQTTDYQTILTGSLALKQGETGSFQIRYTYPGTYHYTASQTAGTDESTTYDKAIYQIDVYVTENENGDLAAEPIIYINGDTVKKDTLTFTNHKTIPTTANESGPGFLTTIPVLGLEDHGTQISIAFMSLFGLALFVSLLTAIVRKKRS